jgi:hypothetical protein
MNEPVPADVARLLWDQDLGRIDLDRDAPVVIERVMARGSWEAMKWLRRRFSKDVLAAFVRTRGRQVLSPRDLAYWALVTEVELPAGQPGPGGGRPKWAGT